MNQEQAASLRLSAGVKKDEPMSLHTSWRVGGPADYYLLPADRDEVEQIIRFKNKTGLPLFVFGNGTNLLVRDGGIRGLVIHMSDSFSYIHREGKSLRAGSGTPLTHLAQAAAKEGLRGLSFAAGIPGTLGGALVMNAGAFGSYVGGLVEEVSVIRPGGEQARLGRNDLVFGYRQSSLLGQGIILEALLSLEEGDPEVLKGEVEQYFAERRRRHPVLPSAGSVFRNPPGNPAGRLIEAAGAKGLSIGAAQVSEQHGNFIVNTGGARARDVETLIREVQRRVHEKFGVELFTEVRIVGEERENQGSGIV